MLRLKWLKRRGSFQPSPKQSRLSPTTKRIIRISALAAVAVIATSGLVFVKAPAQGVTQIVEAAFTGPDNGVAEAEDNNWSVSGNAAATNQSLPAMVDGPDADTTVDRLRLTNTATQSQGGYALYDVAQTTTAGLDITFNIAMHGAGGGGCPVNPADNYNATSSGGSNSGNNCQADGIVFYLKNGTNTDTGAGSIGNTGGSLGYSNGGSGTNGLSGALLGVGLDAYGNFYQQPFGGTNCSNDPSQSTSTFARRSLIFRGPQGSTRTTGYCRITTSGDRTGSGRNLGISLDSSNIFSNTGGAVRVTIDTEDTSGNRTRGTGKVYLAAVGTTDWSTVTPTGTFELPQELSDASTFKFGFVAGTGGGTMNTEIWSTTVNSVRDIPDPAWTTAASQCAMVNTLQSLQLTGEEGVQPYTFSLQSGTLPTGLSLNTSTGILSGTPTTNGVSNFTLRLTDSTSPTNRTVDRAFTYTVQETDCATNVSWSFNSTAPTAPSGGTDGSCSSGTYTQSTVGNYRVAKFEAPSSGNGTCTWSAPTGVNQFEVLAVGGGGGGGYDAGGGGGGGGMAFHSGIQTVASTTASITIGAGGAGSTGTPNETGITGNNSTFTYSSTTLTGNGGTGGHGCAWTGSHCGNDGTGNIGGTGGSASGGTINATGGRGGNGVWTLSSSTFPQNGNDGRGWQTSGTLTRYAGGGGGSGASRGTGTNGASPASVGGAGGGGNGTMTATAPTNGTDGLGGGGGGANGINPGRGGSGVVLIKYTLPQATNQATATVTATIQSLLSVSNSGTPKRQSATLTNSTCGTTWTTETAGVGSNDLTGGKCYRWTYDSGIASGAVLPADSAGASPSSNLTSPILFVPETSAFKFRILFLWIQEIQVWMFPLLHSRDPLKHFCVSMSQPTPLL